MKKSGISISVYIKKRILLVTTKDILNDTVIEVCDLYLLPPLENSESLFDGYYAEMGGSGQFFVPGEAITHSIILYEYSGHDECAQERLLDIRVAPSAVAVYGPRSDYCPYFVLDRQILVVPSNLPFTDDEESTFFDDIRPDSIWVSSSENNTVYQRNDTITESGVYIMMVRYGHCVTRLEQELTISENVILPYETDTVEVCSDEYIFPHFDDPSVNVNYKDLNSNLDYYEGSTYKAFQNGYHNFKVVARNNHCVDSAFFIIDFLKIARSTDTIHVTVCSGQVYPLRIVRAHSSVEFDVDAVIPLLPNSNVDGFQFDLNNIDEGTYLFYVISKSDPRCFPSADTSIFSIRVVDNCTSKDTTFVRCPQFAAVSYFPDILGGAIYDINFNVASDRVTFSENIEEDAFLVEDALFVYRIITDQHGFSDTSVISLIYNNEELGISLSQNELCYRECLEVLVDYDVDDYRNIIVAEASNFFSRTFFFDDSKSKTLRICFDPEKATRRIAEGHDFFTAFDTLFLASSDRSYDLEVRAFGNFCRSGQATLAVQTKGLPIISVNPTICQNESVQIKGEIFDASRMNGEIIIPAPDASQCDSIISISLEIDTTSHLTLRNIFEEDDTVMVRCNPYFKGHEKDTILLSLASNGCDSIIFVDFTFESIRTFDSIGICLGDTLAFGELAITEQGEYEQKFITTYGRDSFSVISVDVNLLPSSTEIIEHCDYYVLPNHIDTIWSTGTYNDTLELDNQMCDSIVTRDIVIHNSTLIDTTIVILNAGETYEHTGQSYAAPFEIMGSATIERTGCDSSYIILLNSQSAEDLIYYVPNIFSPNNDNLNDVFQVYMPDSQGAIINSIGIYDRWGALIWSTTDENQPMIWDGTVNGKNVKKGMYVVMIQFLKSDKTIVRHVRDLTVIR